ncbi:Ribosomal large subunit pseudouridine synthase B [uncultured Clostridium sp.]|uniref:Pseudouridine synthase n=1 Tax=Paeniclostridium hominis TaxID=2764329 RepID=A0ABR7K2B8_9FIRM|nr:MULTISPECIES: pseudouridine synthase [Paeniclostridium]MBC6003250.1 rRNA pseudouridine synthase [Paeniclostridium hominis]SCI78043.1 Ribosomal large subunit pseudouridine synthase B [uncultured Clostridium sp.]SCI92600.1 Ribosomal large subunit pseudouridine synthase B [uncultured Clostridium sp.]
MRINKYIASCGIASRRKAEELILENRVKVNGNLINELSFQINEKKDKVEVDGKLIGLEEKLVYIMLNKPEGYVTTVKDQFDRKSVIDLVKDIDARVYPIGRLDYETSGLLLLTNDGDLTYKLTHPKHEVDKTYIATVKGIPTQNEITNFEKGLYIEDYKTSPAKIKIVKKNIEKNYAVCEIKIHEGRNRQVRKMCKAINHPVMNLRRKAMGKIVLKDVEIGKYRHLTVEEVNYLKNLK